MSTSERDELRHIFFEAWRKHQQKLPVEPLENQIINIILLHPEYHMILAHPENYQAKDFTETNPFLHMSLHLALREQIATNRPTGIKEIYQQLYKKTPDILTVEHQMMECLAQILWDAQQAGKIPDEKNYLDNLRKLL